ncbi:hypothetical protein RhiirA1_475562 [Rhizophagus irregularis]|uniref:TLDc domain-containing protein n=1 Tax=Rhizophagus irregularis TaxID=588596 RepID=A0A2N0QWN4_9GLOM|nr:hypothetical protein RhiirA1_475562 [Rhizophagus irregularis]
MQEIIGGYNPLKWESSETWQGPYFGHDFIIRASKESSNYDEFHCKNIYCEKRLRDTTVTFLAEDYKVYQIIRK